MVLPLSPIPPPPPPSLLSQQTRMEVNKEVTCVVSRLARALGWNSSEEGCTPPPPADSGALCLLLSSGSLSSGSLEGFCLFVFVLFCLFAGADPQESVFNLALDRRLKPKALLTHPGVSCDHHSGSPLSRAQEASQPLNPTDAAKGLTRPHPSPWQAGGGVGWGGWRGGGPGGTPALAREGSSVS